MGFKLISEVTVLLSLLVINILVGVYVKPYHRGFFCNDQSIRYPYKDSTVGSGLLLFISLIAPAIIGFVFQNKTWLRPWTLSFWKSVYIHTYQFFLGFLVIFLMTSACKYSIGRLRPNFMSICKPMPYWNSTSCLTTNIYVTNYTCTGTVAFLNDQAHQSFFSGHSSLSAYAMGYLVFVFQKQLGSSLLVAVRILLQSTAIIIASCVGYSRVSDYWHHWQDVLVGLVAGTLTAILMEVAFKGKQNEQHKLDNSVITTGSINGHHSDSLARCIA